MQFQLTVLCLGVHRVEVDGQVRCYASIAREPVNQQERQITRGYLVQHVTADVRVFEDMRGFSSPMRLRFMCTISDEPGSHYRPHLLALCH